MKDYESLFKTGQQKPVIKSCGCEYVKGNSIELQLNNDDCEVRADVVVSRSHGVRVWGQVRDCDGYPVKNALVKLIRITKDCGKTQVEGVAHTISDCTGFYQFDVSQCEVGAKYRVLVSKAAEGNERIVVDSETKCDPCSESLEEIPCNERIEPCECD